MKVIIAHNRYVSAQPSGENIIVDYEIEALQERGVEVIPFLKSSDDIIGLSTVKKALLAPSPIYARSAQRELTQLIEQHRPDILHIHNVYPLLSPAVVNTAHRHGVKVVQTIHNYRHDCLNGLYFRDGKRCLDCHGSSLSDRWNLPGVRHGCYRGSKAQSAIMASSLGIHHGTWRSVDRFIALTDNMATYLRSIGMSEKQITVKPNAMPDPGPPSPLGTGFFFGARLVPEKGVQLLLEAWGRVPQTVRQGGLTMAGDGPMRAVVEAAAAADPTINYVGQLDRPDMLEQWKAHAVVVVPSIWDDILPTGGIEALAAGRGVVTTNLGGSPFIAGEGTARPAGVVAQPTAESFAQALCEIASSPSWYAGNARRRYEAVFTPEVVLDQLLAIYADVAAKD